jgi:hypothetical protein
MSAIIALVFLLSLIAGAISDIVRYEIPNSLPVVLLVGYLAYAFDSGASWNFIGTNLAVGLAVLLAGAVLFRYGLLEGGYQVDGCRYAVAWMVGVAMVPAMGCAMGWRARGNRNWHQVAIPRQIRLRSAMVAAPVLV